MRVLQHTLKPLKSLSILRGAGSRAFVAALLQALTPAGLALKGARPKYPRFALFGPSESHPGLPFKLGISPERGPPKATF